MKKLSPIRSVAWIGLSLIAAPFAGVTAAICWLQDKVAGETQDWQQVFQAALDARNGRHTPPTDKEQVIKAAVQAIEDVMPGTWDNKCWVCRRYLLAAGTISKNPSCLSCNILSLKPHLQALRGLIDD